MDFELTVNVDGGALLVLPHPTWRNTTNRIHNTCTLLWICIFDGNIVSVVSVDERVIGISRFINEDGVEVRSVLPKVLRQQQVYESGISVIIDRFVV